MSDIGRVSGVERIAVLRGGALGDFMFALPALDALRAAYPEAELVILGRGFIADLVDGRDGPWDRFVPLPELAWLGGQGGLDDEAVETGVLDDLRSESFDLAIQIHGGGRHSNRFVAGMGARVTAGLRTRDAVPLDRTVPYDYYQSEVMRDLEVVALVGAEPVSIEPRYRGVRQRNHEAARELVPARADPLVVIHPSATDARRRWPAESFAVVGDALAGRGATVAVVGTDAERPLLTEVVGRMSAPAVDLCGRLDLPTLAGLLSEADLVIGNDSGPLHLAAAVGTATVGIFWCGNLINAGPFTRSRHRPVLSWRLACPVCGTDCTKGTCEHRVSFVTDAPVEAAIEASMDLLELGQTRPPTQPPATVPELAVI